MASGMRLATATVCLLLLAGAPLASASNPTFTAQAFPNMPTAGCVSTTVQDGLIYLVRTPLCGLSEGQDITFESYDPVTGLTEIIAHLDEHAAQASVESVQGKLYIFPPVHDVQDAVPVHMYDPDVGSVIELASYVIACALDAPNWIMGSKIIWSSNCVWSCDFMMYDTATDTWTALDVSLPGDPGEFSKSGVIFDGAVAHILTYDLTSQVTQFYDYDHAAGTLTPGAIASIPGSSAGPLLATGTDSGIIGRWIGFNQVQLYAYQLASNTWIPQPGIISRAPTLWDGTHGWAFNPQTGGVSCIAMGACLEQITDDPDVDPITDPITDEDSDGFADVPADTPAQTFIHDADQDGLVDGGDNCPAVANADQADLDRDGFGDACDMDVDGDDVSTHAGDNCERVANADQADADDDGIGDACEATAESDQARRAAQASDLDLDTIPDATDNCPSIVNTDQADQDGDAIGSACDVDRDGDGVIQTSAVPWVYLDNCPDKRNADQADRDLDGKGDACSKAVAAAPGLGLQAGGDGLETAGATTIDDNMSASMWFGLGGGALVGAAVAAVTWRRWAPLLAGLFSRQLVGEDPASRRAVLAAVESRPGIHFNELARLVGQGRGAVRHHLEVLQKRGAVRAVPSGRLMCWYPSATRAGQVNAGATSLASGESGLRRLEQTQP